MKVLVLYNKHGEDFIEVPDGREAEVIAKIVLERDENTWYDGSMSEHEEEMLQQIRNGDIYVALPFFHSRKNSEYERWEIVTPRNVLP